MARGACHSPITLRDVRWGASHEISDDAPNSSTTSANMKRWQKESVGASGMLPHEVDVVVHALHPRIDPVALAVIVAASSCG